MKADHNRISHILRDAVTVLCKNSLDYQVELKVEGVIGITLDNNQVLLVHINEAFDTKKVAMSPPKALGDGELETTALDKLPGMLSTTSDQMSPINSHSPELKRRRISTHCSKGLEHVTPPTLPIVIPFSPENTSNPPSCLPISIAPTTPEGDNLPHKICNDVQTTTIDDTGAICVSLNMNNVSDEALPLFDSGVEKGSCEHKHSELSRNPSMLHFLPVPSTSDEHQTDTTTHLITDIKQELSYQDDAVHTSGFQMANMDSFDTSEWSNTSADNSNAFVNVDSTVETVSATYINAIFMSMVRCIYNVITVFFQSPQKKFSVKQLTCNYIHKHTYIYI